ncbi:MAG TPA: MauE/DoxX family redox-associated membrane protein [Flavisolibacter sp.]|nr:MauE/DoxX family redox-associated membrane protein [Flavisolibacter sp.]
MIKKISLVLLILLYIGAGINHFLNPDFYISIMPPYIPAHRFMVALSGIAEILLGLALIRKQTRRPAALLICVMLVAFVPVHIFMLEQAYSLEGYHVTVRAAWFRLFLQPVGIIWALWHARPEKEAERKQYTSMRGA